MKHSHAVSQCAGCALWFSSEVSFNKHRVGSHGEPIYEGKAVRGYEKHSRRCMTEEEMKVAGMAQNEKGLWVTALFEGDASFWRQEQQEEVG